MYRKVWVGLLCIVLMAGGCSPNAQKRICNRAHQKLAGLESYSCTARVFVKGNKQPGEFKTKQWFSAPDRYRLEILEPEDMQGKVTVFDGKRIWMYYPYIDQVFLLDNIDAAREDNLFLGFFLRDMMETEALHSCIEKKNGIRAVVMQIPVPGGNKYRFTQKLYVDYKNLLPVMLEMYDVDGNVSARIEYVDFVYNPDLERELFDSGKVATSMVYEEWDASRMFLGSIREAGRMLDFSPLGTAGIPGEYAADIIQVVESDRGRVLIMTYRGEQGSFTILQKMVNNHEGDSLFEGEILDVGERTVTYSEIQGMRKISWVEGNIMVEVIGDITRKSLMKIAEGIR